MDRPLRAEARHTIQPRARRSASAGYPVVVDVRPRWRPPQEQAYRALVQIGRSCPGRLRGREIGDTLIPRARATPSAGLDCGARLRANPGECWRPITLG